MHFITITVIEWVDIFTKADYFVIIADSLNYCKKHKGLKLYEYVIMPNHIHLMVKAKDGYQLSGIIRDFKKHTTKEILYKLKSDNRRYILNLLNNSFARKKGNEKQIWQRENCSVTISSEKFYLEKANYIHKNPVKQNFVERPGDWLYSSAKSRLCEKPGIVPLELDDSWF